MNKEKIERLILTFLVIVGFFIGFSFGVNDKKVKLCSDLGNDTFFGTVNDQEGCIVYHGEYCKDQCVGMKKPNEYFTFEDFKEYYDDNIR